MRYTLADVRADVATVLRDESLPEWQQAEADYAHARERLTAWLAAETPTEPVIVPEGPR